MKKSLFAVIFAFIALIAGVFAVPLEIVNFDIQEKSGDYYGLVTVKNMGADNMSSPFATIEATFMELGTSVLVSTVNVPENETKVFTYKLNELTNSVHLLKKGNDYTVKLTLTDISTTIKSEKTDSFVFGSTLNTGEEIMLEAVNVNGVSISDYDSIQVMNGEEIKVTMRFNVFENLNDARLMVFIEGYEHSTLVSSTEIFSVKEGVTYTKSLTLKLPADMNSEKEYKLRIVGANDLSGLTYKEYSLYVDSQRHRVDILDLIMTPSSGVEAGQNMVASVRLKNRGQNIQDSVKVSINVPALNIKESSYVSNLGKDVSVTSDDMLLYIPQDAKAGNYEVEIMLSYNNGYTATVDKYTLTVISSKIVSEKKLLVSIPSTIDLKGNEAKSFELVIANPNSDSKPISISVLENTWANVEINPSLIMVQGGASETFKISVTPKSGIEGERTLTLLVKEGSNTIDTIEVKAYVEKQEEKRSIDWMDVLLIVLLIILIIVLLSLIVAIAKRKGNSKDDEYREEVVNSEEYY